MITNLQTKNIKAISPANNFHFLPTRWRQKPDGIDKKRNYVTVTMYRPNNWPGTTKIFSPI